MAGVMGSHWFGNYEIYGITSQVQHGGPSALDEALQVFDQRLEQTSTSVVIIVVIVVPLVASRVAALATGC